MASIHKIVVLALLTALFPLSGCVKAATSWTSRLSERCIRNDTDVAAI